MVIVVASIAALTLTAPAARPTGIAAPLDAASLVRAAVPIAAQLSAPATADLAQLFGDAQDVVETFGDALVSTPAPPETPLSAVTPTRALVTATGPRLVQVTFADDARRQMLTLAFGRRHGTGPNDNDVLVLIMTPIVEDGLPQETINADYGAWVEQTKAGWRVVPPTAAQKAEADGPFTAPFSPCVRALRTVGRDIISETMVKVDEDYHYLPEIERMRIDSVKGASASIKIAKDRESFTADIRYRDGVARLPKDATAATIDKACRPGR